MSMSETGDGQLIKAGLLLAAGVAFAVWQWRDLARARTETARRRAREAHEAHEAHDAHVGGAGTGSADAASAAPLGADTEAVPSRGADRSQTQERA